MAKMVPSPDIRIAALEQKRITESNIMEHGAGTAWEDRGSLGTVKAIFVTCIRSLTSPLEQLRAIRRPETKSDARAFAIVCGVLWAISFAISKVTMHYYYHVEEWDGGEEIKLALTLIATPFLLIGLLELCAIMLNKMNSLEKSSRAPIELVYNVLSYSLGPSLLAIIPIFGPMIASVWIFLLMIAGTNSRLRIKLGTAIINIVLLNIVVSAIVSGLYFLLLLIVSLYF